MTFAESRRLQARSHSIIPGGAHTYAKGDDEYPETALAFIARGETLLTSSIERSEYTRELSPRDWRSIWSDVL